MFSALSCFMIATYKPNVAKSNQYDQVQQEAYEIINRQIVLKTNFANVNDVGTLTKS